MTKVEELVFFIPARLALREDATILPREVFLSLVSNPIRSGLKHVNTLLLLVILLSV